jgi:hypothetical protein
MKTKYSKELNDLIRKRNERLLNSQSNYQFSSQSRTPDYGRANYYNQSSVGTKGNQFLHLGGFHNTYSVKPGVWE